ncbi:MAG: VOC family protein [bacterium]
MEMLKNAINWFEIPVTNFERAKKFYSAIYDYEMPEQMMGPNRMGFFLSDMENRGIGGAIVQGNGYVPTKDGVKVYLSAGNDLTIVLNCVAKAGGKVLLAKTLVGPDLGYFAVIEDTEGNNISLHSMN